MTAKDLRVLVVDDEPLARRGLARQLDAIDGFQIAGECANGRDAVDSLAGDSFDLVLLDVEMPELDGFGVLAEVGAAAMPPVIFVTAYDQYAVRAFEAHALDYVVKPVDPARLAQALGRARDAHRTVESDRGVDALLTELDDQAPRPTRIAARASGRTLLVPVEEIDWVQAADNYVRLYCKGKIVLHRETLAHLGERLDPTHFLRVHRSHVINIQRVREVRPTARGDAELWLEDGTRLPVSRSFRRALEEALGRD